MTAPLVAPLRLAGRELETDEPGTAEGTLT